MSINTKCQSAQNVNQCKMSINTTCQSVQNVNQHTKCQTARHPSAVKLRHIIISQSLLSPGHYSSQLCQPIHIPHRTPTYATKFPPRGVVRWESVERFPHFFSSMVFLYMQQSQNKRHSRRCFPLNC